MSNRAGLLVRLAKNLFEENINKQPPSPREKQFCHDKHNFVTEWLSDIQSNISSPAPSVSDSVYNSLKDVFKPVDQSIQKDFAVGVTVRNPGELLVTNKTECPARVCATKTPTSQTGFTFKLWRPFNEENEILASSAGGRTNEDKGITVDGAGAENQQECLQGFLNSPVKLKKRKPPIEYSCESEKIEVNNVSAVHQRFNDPIYLQGRLRGKPKARKELFSNKSYLQNSQLDTDVSLLPISPVEDVFLSALDKTRRSPNLLNKHVEEYLIAGKSTCEPPVLDEQRRSLNILVNETLPSLNGAAQNQRLDEDSDAENITSAESRFGEKRFDDVFDLEGGLQNKPTVCRTLSFEFIEENEQVPDNVFLSSTLLSPCLTNDGILDNRIDDSILEFPGFQSRPDVRPNWSTVEQPIIVEAVEVNSSTVLQPVEVEVLDINSPTTEQLTETVVIQKHPPTQEQVTEVEVMVVNEAAEEQPNELHMNSPSSVHEDPPKLPEEPAGSRKRLRNESTWKRNVRKKACNSGLEYRTEKGDLRPARSMGEGCKQNCMYKCHSKISEQERQAFFNQYWGLKNHTRQWDFINQYVFFSDPARPEERDNPKRSTGKYHIRSSTGLKIRVCQTMFLSTLNISEKPVRTAVERLKTKGATISPDHRGENSKVQRFVVDRLIATIDEHISMFPVVPSHFCRQRSRRKYLEAGLSINKMYTMYQNWMKEKYPDVEAASARRYRDRFVTKYNLGFFVPRKDQCELCNIHSRATPEIKAKIQKRLDDHIKNKDLARNLRNADTDRAKSEPNVCVALFDLQKVLSTPKDNTGCLYYKSKIAVFNLTMFELHPRIGSCFVWHEGEGKRGANEIASCLQKFISSYLTEHKDTTEFIFWSDNCFGQNKNKFLFTLFAILSQRYNVKIVMRYMETGHTMSSCDSVHKNIEVASKHKSMFTPECWYKLMEEAAKVNGQKYKVVRMNGEIVDLHGFCDTHLKWNGHGINWKLVREVVLDPKKPQGTVSVRSSFAEDAVVKTINVMKVAKGRPPNLKAHTLKPAYEGRLRLTNRKLYDLGTLCGDQVIPSEFHEFYKTLVDFKVIVRMPELRDQPPPPEEENDEEPEGLLEGNDEPDPDYGGWFQEELKKAGAESKKQRKK